MDTPKRFAVQPWQFHDHPTSGYRIILDMNRLTVFEPDQTQLFFDVSQLPPGEWVTLRTSGQGLPVRVLNDGYIAGLSPQGRLLAEWLPVDEQLVQGRPAQDPAVSSDTLEEASNEATGRHNIAMQILQNWPKVPGSP